MKYLFILGRNPELSIAELRSFFKKNDNGILDLQQKDNAVLIDFEEPLDAGVIELLGGTIAIGRVLCDVSNMEKTEIYFSEENNFSYVVWDFSNETENVSSYLKKRFRREKLKASEKRLREEMELQNPDDGKGQHLSSKTVDEQYFVFGDYFGKIVQFSNYEEIEKRDMEKPVRRESLSISPRLAKIMINLSEVNSDSDEILLDGFCGIGVVLSEALNMGIKVVGVDMDENAIKGCKENLNWFKFPERNYNLFNDDSSKIDLSKFKDKIFGIASEPDFGETLKKIPTEDEARKTVRRYENIMASVLNNIKKYVSDNARFVFSSPYIRVMSKKRIGVDFEKFSERIGLKLVKGFPIDEFRDGQIVGRQIVVYESQ